MLRRVTSWLAFFLLLFEFFLLNTFVATALIDAQAVQIINECRVLQVGKLGKHVWQRFGG